MSSPKNPRPRPRSKTWEERRMRLLADVDGRIQRWRRRRHFFSVQLELELRGAR